MTAPILAVEDLVVHYRTRRDVVHAVCGVSFEIAEGEAFGLVGESGCGKTTTGRTILGLQALTAGRVAVRGTDIATLRGSRLRALRRDVQLVFQDPSGSLDPRMSVGDTVAEPLRVHGLYRDAGWQRVISLLADVGLPPSYAARFPRELSGGQRQRVGIARALATRPSMLVLDEPVSALDVSVRAGVVNLLADIRARQGLSYLLVAHDLALVRHVCDRVAVMYLGRIVELATRDDVFARPGHPYTQALLSAVPRPDPRAERTRERIVLPGDPPRATDPPSGCRFRSRCQLFVRLSPDQQRACIDEQPALVPRGQGHPVACHYA